MQKNTIILLVLFAICCLETGAAETPVVPYTGPSGEMVLSMNSVSQITLSLDNTILAGKTTSGIYFWDLLPEPKLRKEYLPSDLMEKGGVQAGPSVFILPENRLLVVTSVIQIFDLNTLELKQRIPLDSEKEDYSASFMAVSHDGKFVVMKRSQPYRIQLWNIEKGVKAAETLLEENEEYLFLSFSPDDSNLFLTGRDGRADLWDAKNLQFIRSMQDGNGHYYKHCFSPDGQSAAAGTSDGYLVKWDISTGKKLFEVSNHSCFIYNVFFTPDGKSILTSHESRYLVTNNDIETFIQSNEEPALILCDSETGKESKKLVSSISEFFYMVMGDNKTYGVDRNSRITCWNLESGEIFNQFGDEFYRPIDFAASPDNTQFAVVTGFSRIDVYDRKTFRVIRSIDNGEKCEKIQYSPNGKFLLAINTDGTLVIRDTVTGSLKQKIVVLQPESDFPPTVVGARAHWINSVQFFQDNLHLLVLSTHSLYDHYDELQVYNIETGKVIAEYNDPNSESLIITNACVSPSGDVVVLYAGFLERWDYQFKNKFSSDYYPLPKGSSTFAFTDDGSILYASNQTSHYEIDWKTGERAFLIPDSDKILFWINTWMEQDLLMLQEAYVRSNDPVESLIVNWKTGEQVAKIPGAYLAKFTPDKSCIISNTNEQLTVWDTNRVLYGSSGIKDAMLY